MFDKKEKQYKVVHKTAKFIAAAINTVLLSMIFEIDHVVLFGLINLTYFFGVNTIAKILEKILHFKDQHDWV